jgi:hypothetical protein
MALPWMTPRTSLTRAPGREGTKRTPSEADYKPASDDSKKRCHECKNYGKYGEPEADCGIVIGIVKAEGVCDMFTQREYTSNQQIVIEVRGG